MKSGFERENRSWEHAVCAVANAFSFSIQLRRDKTARQEFNPPSPSLWRGKGCETRVEFRVLSSSMVGILCLEMRSSPIKPNQSKSNLFKTFLRARLGRTWC